MIAELQAWDDVIGCAAERLGIAPGPVDWRLVEADRLYELAAVGMPGVMRHWTHGRDYWIERSRFSRGEGRLYEMIVHADPPIAYLLDGNTLPAQKLVMAHCLGHAEIFRHHAVFQAHPTDYPTRLAAQEQRRHQYASEYGPDAVDWVLDRAYALEDQVAEEPARPLQTAPTRIDPFADLFPRAPAPKPLRPPRYRLPTRDVLGFLARESPVLADWERDLCLSVRQESIALAPNRQVKILHEGWAAWVQQQICTDPAVPLADWEQAEMAVLWSRVASPWPHALNPYWFGWRFITWMLETHGWAVTYDTLLTETDASWVRNWLTPDAARALELYRYTWSREAVPQVGRAWVARRLALPTDPDDWAAWREALAASLVREPPELWVTDVRADGTLVLTHQTPRRPLDPDWAAATLKAVRDLWGGPATVIDGDETYAVGRKETTHG